MEISGEYTFKAPIDRVWNIMMSPQALKTAVPGCEKFEEAEPNVYDVTMKIGVGPIKGTYTGRISIADTEPPHHYKLIVGGQGGPGFVNGEGIFDLAEQDEGDTKTTLVTYKGTANVGGTLAGIGARMLLPVARKMAGDFFKRMEAQLEEGSATGPTEAQPS